MKFPEQKLSFQSLGGRLNNNVLIFERGHPFLVECLNQMFERFVLNTRYDNEDGEKYLY